MPGHREVPRWRFGDVLTSVDHTLAIQSRAMFVAWDRAASTTRTSVLGDWDPNESVPVLVLLDHDESISVLENGRPRRVIRPYCGWWTDAEA